MDPVVLLMIPFDPPADLWLPRSFDHVEQTRLIGVSDCGSLCSEAIIGLCG